MRSNSPSSSPLPTPGALGIIGAGRVGSVLAYHFQKSNLSVAAIFERDEQKPGRLLKHFPQTVIHSSLKPETLSECGIIFICVQDDQLYSVVEEIRNLSLDLAPRIVAHTSGVYSADILSSLRENGAGIASAHPIYAFGDEDPSETWLGGVYFDLEGEAEALTVLKKVFQQCGIHTLEISAEQKIAVHLASVFYSNFFVGLTGMAQEVLRATNISPKHHWQPFLPLIESTLKNLSQQSPEGALTGPIKRGDVHTIEEHLDFIARRRPQLLPLYIEMSRAILEFSHIPEAVKSKLSGLLERQN